MTFDEKCSMIERIRSREFAARAAELEALEVKYGPEVEKIVLEARAKMIEREWREIAKSAPVRGVRGIVDTLWKGMEDIGFRFAVERIDKGVKFKVSYCPIAQMVLRMGKGKWGYACYCVDDYSIVRGFDPAIRFTRTKTLMQGHDCCDHCYTE